MFLRKAFIKGAGYTDDALDRPIIGIIDTSSSFNPCHGNVNELLKAVERGVQFAGALPMRFPTISLHESFTHPTSMYLRNLMSIDTEEMLKAQPIDAVVMIGGCDKTVPAQLMGAFSANIPCISLVTGPMMTGSYSGRRVGACTDCRAIWKDFRAGLIDIEELARANDALVPTVGTCGVMGTASTMACITEALGLMPLGSATAPAISADRIRIAERTGQLAVSLAKSGRTPEELLSRKNFENAVTVLQAIGGSTNAIVHLLAIAARLPNVTLDLEDFDTIGKRTPLLVDIKPSGANYMEDFHKAGGMPALLRCLKPLLHMDARTICGNTLQEELDQCPSTDFVQTIIKELSDPIFPAEALVVLKGNLAPDGCVFKQSAAASHLRSHKGPTIVFNSAEDMIARIDSEVLQVSESSVLVLRNIGPVGFPGMPEAGLIPIPKKLARAGVKDMLRISDGRMSGTAEGAVILHVSPESAVGGPLAFVMTGDQISVDVSRREITLHVSQEELDLRRREGKAQKMEVKKMRGYRGLYHETVNQAHQGADFAWLRADGGVS